MSVEATKPTKLGTASFVLAIVVAILWCIYFVVFGLTIEGNLTFGTDSETAGYMLILGMGVLGILTILITFTGIVLGILAIRRQDPKRNLAIAGLVLNFLCFAPYCVFFIMFAFGAVSSSDFSQYIPN
jgi:magnesium-transporting ATPase (P-type)